MAVYAHRRQILLFIAAILLPCTVLIALGLRMITQERELAESRLADERALVAGLIRRELSVRLNGIVLQQGTEVATRPERLQESEYDHPAVVLVARVADGQLVLPWENDDRPTLSRTLLQQGEFARRFRRAEREEFVTGELGRATVLFQEALEVAEHPIQRAQAQLSRARTLAKSGRDPDALAGYRAILTVPAEIVDEHGVPVSLYAAARLLDSGIADQAVLECLQRALRASRWLPPAALSMLRDLVDGFIDTASDSEDRDTATHLNRGLSDYLECTQQALALQRDFSSLGLGRLAGSQGQPQERWIVYGTPAWLVGAMPSLGGRNPGVVAVRYEAVLASLETVAAPSGDIVGELSLISENSSAAVSLGPAFPGLAADFLAGDDVAQGMAQSIRVGFYLFGLLLVIGVTLFGAFLLWRDVHRELRLAEMRSRFVAAVSHELKTPLTGIRMFTEMLHVGQPTDPDTQAEYLETILSESERLTRLLNNVLDFSRIERGQKTYRREPHDLAEIVQSTSRAMTYPLEQQNFALHVKIEEGLPPALVDRDGIEQAILNLLINAMKYSRESRDIDLHLRSQDGRAIIEVSDRGVGIDPDEQVRIFEQFYRVPSPDNERIPGTGLGLTLVQHIARAHGGTITVKSAVGEGSTFSMHLPFEGADS
jgi:signal transduction histidine kinase